jgi:hypothetical protein
MQYTMTTPCDACPFTDVFNNRRAFTTKRLLDFCKGEFPCHKTADINEDSSEFEARGNSAHCAGALIFMAKRNRPHQMMRIAERIGMLDRSKLDMEANVR